MAHVSLDATTARPPGAWYRDVTPAQWKAFIGAYLAWVLDGFDFTILTFLLVDIQRSFTVD
jgi:SHS family sialic acid transporter-like MFS transporter